MSEKRIQRKHFLAALGAAIVGTIGGEKLLARRSAKNAQAVAVAHRERRLATDPRSVARPADS